jgi:hypothetical protein
MAGAEYYVRRSPPRPRRGSAKGLLYNPPVAKRGYTRDTIRGGASEWDVSRPFSSYLRTLATLLVHPVRFFELLPKVADMRAPGLFLAFSGLPAALIWLLFWGLYPALVALVLPLPLSFPLAGVYHLGALRGRYAYAITWRVLAYPLGFFFPIVAVPVLGLVGATYAGLVLVPLGLAKAQEVWAWRGVLAGVAVALLVALTAVAVGY